MLTENAFFEMIKIVEKTKMPLSLRLEVIHVLNYFAHQSKADHDRRDKPETIKKHWRAIEGICEQHGVLKALQGKPELWTSISTFLGQPFKGTPQTNPGDDFAFEFFKNLESRLATLRDQSNSDFAKIERGLQVIQSQARLPKYQRDRNTIKGTWIEIHPALKKWGLMDDFKREHQLQQKIKFFISGTF